MTLSTLRPSKRSPFARMTAAILLGMEAARLSSSYTWMLDQALAISPFKCTRLVGRLLLMHLFIMFHTSSILFRSGLLSGQLSTWMLHSCSHALTFFVCRSVRSVQEPDVAEKPCLHRHTNPLWMKEDDSLTLPYTQYVVYATVDLRKTILPIPLIDTQPHRSRTGWGPVKTVAKVYDKINICHNFKIVDGDCVPISLTIVSCECIM